MRSRDLGIVIGRGRPGPLNAITDVPGVRVGHTTLISGDGPLVVGQGPVRTGVTVVVPRGDGDWREPVFAGCHRLNGNGELTGLEWVRESGMLTTPIAITNTHSVGVVRDALVAAALDEGEPTELVVVAAGRRRDLRRAAQRHERVPRPGRAPARGPGGRDRRSRRGGRRRRRHGHGLPRVQGRHRDGVAGHPRRARRLHGRGAGPGELRQARVAARGRRAGRRRDRPRRGPQPVRPGRGACGRRPRRPVRARSSSSSRPTPRCSPTSASGWPSAPGSASPGRAAPAATRAATCSSRSRPATGCRRRPRAGRRP